MTKRKRLITIILAAVIAVCLSLGVYFLCNSNLFVLADLGATGENLTMEQLDANSEYLIGSYIDAYGVPASAIKTSETNGETASGSLSGIFDRNFNTAWRSKASINDTVTSITATFYFKDVYKLDGFLYQAESGGRGYFSDLEVSYHGANDYDGSEFHTFGSIQSTATGRTVYIKFNEPTDMTAVRLEWKDAPVYSGAKNASASEIVFLQPEDQDVEEALALFSDYAQLKLQESVNDETVKSVREALQQKSKKLASWESFLDPLLNRASQIYNKALSLDPRREMGTDPESTNLLGRHGDVAGYARNTLKFSNFGTNRQATGVSARPGDVITVYVEAEEGDPLPSLVFSQHWGTAMMAWKSGNYTLHRGRNVIVAPTLHIWGLSDNNGEPVPSGGPIYLVNPYLPKEEELPEGRTEQQQSSNVKIYIEGGTAIPIFRKGGDVDAYLSDLAEYAELIEQDKMDNGDTLNYTMVDVTEVVCDRMTLTVQATRGNYYYNELGYDPQEACENWDDYVKKLLMFDGVVFLEEDEDLESEEFQKKLDSVYGKYDSRNEWLSVNIRLMQPWGAAYAAPEHVGIQVGWDGSGLIGQGWGWGYSHEIGHMLDITERLVGECSNNMISKFDETVLEKVASRGDFAQNLAQLSPDDHMESYFNTNRLNFTIWWLIESYFPGYWTKLENYYRYYNLYEIVKNERKADETLNATEKQIFLSSLVTGIDLSYYFERWGYNLSGGNPIFVYEKSSALFQRMMTLGRQQGLFSNEFQPKLWYLDAAEWWERYDEKSYAENPSFKKDFNKGALYSENDKAPSILNITKSGNSYSLMIDLDEEKFGKPEHLGYEVQIKEMKDGEETWKVVGFTYGRIFSDPHDYAIAPTYRLVAYDRALHHSAPGDAKTHDSVAIKDVCKIEREPNKTYNSIAEAVATAQEGDTIILLKSSYESGILIDKTLTIKTEDNLAEKIKITKSGSEPIFKVVERTSTLDIEGEDGSHTYQEQQHLGKLTLIGVILDGFGIESDGSLVLVEAGDLTVEKCTFQDGKYKYGNDSMGGALRFMGSNLTVKETTFKGNSARLGGAVCVTHRAGSVIAFEDCTFKDNSAREGGGLYNTGTVTLTNCTFEGNNAESVGGGFANVSGGVMEVRTCTFKENITDGKGGGFYADGRVDLYGGTFTGNRAADGAAFCYWRSSGAARPFYAYGSNGNNAGELPTISGNYSEEGSAVTLHGQVDRFEAEISGNSTKYAVRLGGASINLDGGTIQGAIFREAAGKVTLNSNDIFTSEEKIVVYTDSQEAHLVILSAGKEVTLTEEDAKKFIGENKETPAYDTERSEIVIELNSYTVTFNIKIDENKTQTETKHYRPGSTFTFESFTGNKDQKWYVKEWRDSEGKPYKIGEKFEVIGDVVFNAVVGQKFRIEFKVNEMYDGVKSQTFYAMPGEKYSLPKFEIDGYAHNGWEIETADASGKTVTKMYQPAKSFRAADDRTYTAVIVKKFTVQYTVEGRNGLKTLCFATRSVAYGSKLTWESCDDEDYVPYGGFIEGFYIRNSDGTCSENLVDFNTYTVTSDLVLVAKVIEKSSMICYMIYEDGIGEKDGHFVGDSMFSYIAYDTEYSLNLLPIPDGYHLTSLMLNSETLDPETANGYTFTVEDYSYLVVAYVEKNTYSITYQCNDVPFRTDTVYFGSTITFTDPTDGLLKEAVRGYKDLTEDSSYSFSNYQLISSNPRAGELDEPEKIKLNIMLGDQITVTENLTINIIAYIEGHEYEADESAGNTVEEWRLENRTEIDKILKETVESINDPMLILSEKERAGFIVTVNTAASTATEAINKTVSFDEMRTARLQFEEAAEKTRSEALVRAAKNAAKSSVVSAMDAALKAFEGMEDEEGADTIEQARKSIQNIAKNAQDSIEANPDGNYVSIVDHAIEEMQNVVIKCNGDRLAMQKGNAITNATGFADSAKRKIDALPYLSSGMKENYREQIDGALEKVISDINAVTPRSSAEGDLAEAIKEITGLVIPFEQNMDGLFYGAQKYSDSKLRAVGDETDVPDRGDALIAYAAEITEKIETLLQERTADIRADGIILSNEELIAKLTAFADEKLASVASILSDTLAVIAEICEDEQGTYKREVEKTVQEAKTKITAEKAAVETDFSAKTEEAEQNSRNEIISLYITALAEETLNRFDELTLDGEDFASQVTGEQEKAIQAVQHAGNIMEIETAVVSFRENVTKIRLDAETKSALAVITFTLEESGETLKGYDFLEEEWLRTYTENISAAAETAKTQIETAAKAEDVISIGNTFSAAVQTTLGEAKVCNETKGAEAKVTALEEIDRFANGKCSEIGALGFLDEEQKVSAKGRLKAATEEAKKNVSDATSKHGLEAFVAAFKTGVTGTDGIFTVAEALNRSIAAEKKGAAKSKAENDAELLEGEIGALSYLTAENRRAFSEELQSKLKQAIANIEASLTASGVEDAAATFEHELTALRALATETNNAIHGDLIARAMTEAIDAVSKKIDEIRAQTAELAFLTEETRKPFSDKLGEALKTATLAIRAATEESAIPALQKEQIDIAEKIGEEAAAKNGEIKAQAIGEGIQTLDAAANTAKTAINGLFYLDVTEKSKFTAAVEKAKEDATAEINAAETPAAIDSAVSDCKAEIETETAKAKAADALAEVKSGAAKTLSEQKTAIEAIEALGFLTEDEKSGYCGEVTSAATAAEKSVNSATAADDVSRAMSAFTAKIAFVKSAAEQKNGENEITFKAEKKALTSERAKEFYSVIESQDYITQEKKELYTLSITELVQSTDDKIAAATDIDGIDSAYAAFEAELEKITELLGEANKESRQASIQSAIAAVDTAAKAAQDAVNALRGKFLDEAEIDTYLQKIEDGAASAKAAIGKADTVEGVDNALASCVEEMKRIAAEAMGTNAEQEKAAKAQESLLKGKYDSAKGTLGRLNHLTNEEQEAFDTQLQDAVKSASTHILDAENQNTIESALAELEAEIDGIQAEATLRDAKNDMLAQAKAAAQEAESAVESLEALSDDLKETYKGNIEAQLALAETAIENAENEQAAADVLESLTSSLDSVKQGAEKDSRDNALAAKKTEVRTDVAEQGENAKQQIDELDSLDDVAKETFKAQIDDYIETANAAVAGATDEAGVQSALEALSSALADIAGKATEANESRKAELQQAEADRLAKLAELKKDLKKRAEVKAAAEREKKESFTFLAEDDKNTYTSAIETALEVALKAIDAAGTEEIAYEARTAFEETILKAQEEALAKNAERKQAAKVVAEQRVTEMVEEAKNVLGGHGFISLISFEDDLKLAEDTARAEIQDAEQQTEIDTAVTTLETKITEIKTNAEAENRAATAAARSSGKEEVADLLKKINESLAELGFISAEDHAEEIKAAVQTANAAVESAKDNRAIGSAVSDLVNTFDGIMQQAVEQNALNQNIAVNAALQEITEGASSAKDTVNGLVFLDVKDMYLNSIDAAVENAEGLLRSAQSSAALKTAKEGILNEISMASLNAVTADLAAKTDAVNAAKKTVEEETKAASGGIGALGFVSAKDYDVAVYATKANAAIDGAADRDTIKNAIAVLQNALKGIVETATAANETARATAVSDGKAKVETQRTEAIKGLDILGFVGTETYQAEITAAASDASLGIENAASQTEIDGILQTLAETFTAISGRANDENELAKSAAVNTALREVETERKEAEGKIDSLRLLTDKKAYQDRIAESAEKAKEALAVAADTEAVNTAKAAALDEFDVITSDAQAAHDSILQEINTAIEAAKETLLKLKETIEKAIGALGFLRGGSSIALMAIDETTKESFLATLDAAYQTALDGLTADKFTSGSGVADYVESVSAELKNIQTNAEAVNSNNETSVKDEARAAIKEAEEGIEELLKDPNLSADKKKEYEAELRTVVTDAETAMESADDFGAVEGLLVDFRNGADLIEEMIQNAIEEDAAVQIVVEGIRAVGKTYDGTDSIEFDLSGVIYRNALTGEEIPSEFTGDFKLTVSGRLSDYNVGKQIVLITSISLESSFIESGEFVLALSGQQAFAEVEVEKARLIVRAIGDGSVEYEGFVNGEDESVLEGKLTVERRGNVLTPRGLESANYEIEFVSGIVTEESGHGSDLLWAVLVALYAAIALGGVAAAAVFVGKKQRKN